LINAETPSVADRNLQSSRKEVLQSPVSLSGEDVLPGFVLDLRKYLIKQSRSKMEPNRIKFRDKVVQGQVRNWFRSGSGSCRNRFRIWFRTGGVRIKFRRS